MLFKRLHYQFTGLCALITMAILALFSVLYLSVSERTLWEKHTLSFQHDFDTLRTSLEQQPALTHSFLLRMEQTGGYMIFLWDNGIPPLLQPPGKPYSLSGTGTASLFGVPRAHHHPR